MICIVKAIDWCKQYYVSLTKSPLFNVQKKYVYFSIDTIYLLKIFYYFVYCSLWIQIIFVLLNLYLKIDLIQFLIIYFVKCGLLFSINHTLDFSKIMYISVYLFVSAYGIKSLKFSKIIIYLFTFRVDYHNMCITIIIVYLSHFITGKFS